MKTTRTLRILVVFTVVVTLTCPLSTGLTAAEEKPVKSSSEKPKHYTQTF